MVVVMLAGLLVAMAAVTAFPDDRARLHAEADRLAQLWMMAHDEAQARGIPVLWEADAQGYRFVLRDGLQLVALEGDAALRARDWTVTPMEVIPVQGASATQSSADRPVVRLMFVRAPAQDPVQVMLAWHDARWLVAGDGLGRYEVLDPRPPAGATP